VYTTGRLGTMYNIYDQSIIDDEHNVRNCIRQNVSIFDPSAGALYEHREFPDMAPIFHANPRSYAFYTSCKQYMIEFYIVVYEQWYYSQLLHIGPFHETTRELMSVEDMWKGFIYLCRQYITRQMGWFDSQIPLPITHAEWLHTMAKVDRVMRPSGESLYIEAARNVYGSIP
jgi:hypothetical protein